MKINYTLISFIIGLMIGIIFSIFTGIITLSTGIVISISALIGAAFNPVSTIISDEFKRWRDKKEEVEKDFEMRFKKHTSDQIIPMFENISEIKLLPRNMWRDLTYNLVLHDLEFLSKKDYYAKSIEHLKKYDKIWSSWLKMNNMIEEFNKNGNDIINICLHKVNNYIKEKLPEFIPYDDEQRLTYNSYKLRQLTNEVVFQRLYENIYNTTIEYGYYSGKIKTFDNEYDLLTFMNEVAMGKKEKIFQLSDICYNIGRHFDVLFNDEIKKTKELQELHISIKNLYEQYKNEFKIEISKIKAGDPLLGRCIICKDWL